MRTTLRNCDVPWAISPTAGGITLIHEETDVSPQCRVVLGAGRLTSDGRTDLRRVEIVFEDAYFTRTAPHDDTSCPSSYGFEILNEYDGSADGYSNWRCEQWAESGICPDSGFYVAVLSDWIGAVPNMYRDNSNHYLLDGRDGHVELIASKYEWSEWTIDGNVSEPWSDVWPLESAVYRSNSGL